MNISLTFTLLSLSLLQLASTMGYTNLTDILNAGKANIICTTSNVCSTPFPNCLTQTTFSDLYPGYNPSGGEPPGVCVSCWDSQLHCLNQQICVNYTCAPCQADAECALSTPTRRYCNRSSAGNFCYGCSDKNPCVFADKARCNLTNSQCVACTVDNDCLYVPGGKKICSTGICVECTSNADCASNVCNLTTQTCQGAACSISNNCLATSLTMPVCSNSYCMSCIADPNTCIAQNLICSSNGSCEKCYLNQHCTQPSKSKCTSNICELCSQDTDCTHLAMQRCLTSQGCVQCTSNTHCTDPLKSICDGSTNTCKLCQYNQDCSHLPATPKCGATIGCVECVATSDCQNPTRSKCDATINSCRACTSDVECEHLASTSRCNIVGGNPGVCVQCKADTDCSTGYKCMSYRCTLSPPPVVDPPKAPVTISSMILSLFESDQPDVFIAEFSEEPAPNIDVTLGIKAQLLGVNSTDYTYLVTRQTNRQYLVIIRPLTTIPPAILSVTYSQPGSSQRWAAEILTQRIPFITQEQKEVSETMKTVSEATLIAMASLSGTMIILSANPAVFFNLVDTMQSFYYLGAINVKFPPNAQIFYKSFAAGGLNFIPNPIKSWLPSVPTPRPVGRLLTESSQSTPSSNLFLANAGNMMFVWIALIIIFAIVLLAKMYSGCISKWVKNFFNKVFGWLHWSGVLRIILVTYPKLTQAALIQVNSITFDAAVFIISAAFGIIFLLFGVLFPLASILIIRNAQKDPELLKTKYKPLIGEFSLEGTMPKYFTAIALLRRLITLSSQVFLRDFPYAQVSLLTAMGVVNIVLLARFRPYAAKSSNVIMILSELLFTVLHVLILIGVHDDQTGVLSDNAKINLGWGMLGCSGLILAVSLEACILAQVAVLKAVIAALQKKKKQSAQVLPAVQDEKDGNRVKRSQRKIDQGRVHIEEERSEIMEINPMDNFSFTTTTTNLSTISDNSKRMKNPRTLERIQRLKEMNQ